MPSEGFVTSITRQSENFPDWYNDVVRKAELADEPPGIISRTVRVRSSIQTGL